MTNDCKKSDTTLKKFCCEECCYDTSRKSSLDKHLLTAKHQRATLQKTQSEIVQSEIAQPAQSESDNNCLCGKTYKFRQGLFAHRKTCAKVSSELHFAHTPSNNVIIDFVKQSNEFIELILEQNKQIIDLIEKTKSNTTTINNVGNNNNHFNLQFFLNDKCKDALNMTDFLNTIVIQLKDLENSLALGYSDGLSKVIVTALNALDTCKRPIHCSDLKRETLYIKDGDVWEKDCDDRKKIKKVINSVENKTIHKLAEWPKTHPNSLNGSHVDNTTYMKIVRQVSGGDLSKEETNVNKIIANIAQKVIIDKE